MTVRIGQTAHAEAHKNNADDTHKFDKAMKHAGGHAGKCGTKTVPGQNAGAEGHGAQGGKGPAFMGAGEYKAFFEKFADQLGGAHALKGGANIDIDVDVDIDVNQAHCPPAPPKPEVEGKVEVTQGRIWGDPHFVGADGGKYDVQGEAGKTYNILSDKGIQMNAQFKEFTNPGTTVVGAVGITTDTHNVVVGPDGGVIVDGDIAIPHQDGSYINGLVDIKNGKVTVNAGEYSVEFSKFDKRVGGFINNIEIRSKDANSDHVLPSGLWGATVDGDGQARNGDKGKGTQGGGAIEGLDGTITEKGDKTTVKQYEVGGLLDTNFQNHNVFSMPQHPQGGGMPGWGGGAQIDIDIDVDISIDQPHCPPKPEHEGKVEVTQGRIWGDPHFVGADGGKYDVQGEAGKTYNILSDKDIQMNATFKQWNHPGTTVVEGVGISTGGHQVEITKDGQIKVDGEALVFPKIYKDLDLPHGLGTKHKDGSITIKAGEYDIKFSDFQNNAKSGAWINNIDIRSADANSDHVLPSGLWGATVDGDGIARNGDTGKGTQGGGAIEDLDGNITDKGDKTTVQQYEVDGLFDTDFANHNINNAPLPGHGGGNVNIDINVEIKAKFEAWLAQQLHNCPPGEQPEPQDPIAVKDGRVWGDPHFVGADGGKYDVQGEAGKTYSILSDQGIQVNALFDQWKGHNDLTMVRDAGVSLGDNDILIKGNGNVLLNGHKVDNGTYLDGALEVKDGKVFVTDEEYKIEFRQSGGYVNDIYFNAENAVADGVLPHGLWGVTVDGDGEARNGDKGKGVQGGGAIEDVHGNIVDRGDKSAVGLYEVGGLFDTDFDTFNKFDARPDAGGGFWGNMNGASFLWSKLDLDIGIDINANINLGGGHVPAQEHQPQVWNAGW